jgi:hypothetical protein
MQPAFLSDNQRGGKINQNGKVSRNLGTNALGCNWPRARYRVALARTQGRIMG